MEERLDRRGGPPPTRVSGPVQGFGAASVRPIDPRIANLPRDAAAIPSLPSLFWHALERGLAELGQDLGPAARTAIDAHVRLLLAWNAAMNLTAIVDPEAVAVRHVVDSLTARPLLADTGSILDLGSGGGFPGLPLAATLPTVRMTLLDSVAKKAAFLDVVRAAAGLEDRVGVAAERAEDLAAGPARVEAVVARGVGSLPDLVELALPLLSRGGRLIAWKRGSIADELAAARRAAHALGGDRPIVRPITSAVDGRAPTGLAGHCLVEVRKAGPTPPGYPRAPAIRRRRPW